MDAKKLDAPAPVRHILPKAGLVYSEKAALTEILCKPKIMPIKSATLEKMEAMEKAIAVAPPATAGAAAGTQ